MACQGFPLAESDISKPSRWGFVFLLNRVPEFQLKQVELHQQDAVYGDLGWKAATSWFSLLKTNKAQI